VQVVKNELTIFCDVDGTIIRPSESGSILMPYGSTVKRFEPIVDHVELLKAYKNRGFYVVVWSMGGPEWAELAVKALKLERFVDLVIGKPLKHMDDKEDLGSIVGNRVFLI